MVRLDPNQTSVPCSLFNLMDIYKIPSYCGDVTKGCFQVCGIRSRLPFRNLVVHLRPTPYLDETRA